MIALTLNIAKLYHTLESQRVIDFMIANKYLDPTGQKAYIDGVNGCVEHITMVQEIIDNATNNKKSAHLTWFDLEDAFGSLSHDIISYVFEYYNIPKEIVTYITSLYTKLKGSVETKEWISEEFHFNKGAFQGDPFSGAIFLVSFNPIIQYIKKHEQNQGYQIKLKNKSVRNAISTPFADDFNIISKNKTMHQKLVTDVEKKIRTMGLVLKPRKCRALSIKSGKAEIINFHLTDEKGDKVNISSVLVNPLKFLGAILAESNTPSARFELIHQKLKTKLENIDKSSIRGEYKLAIYSRYALPSMRFFMSVHQINKSHLESLDLTARKFLKSWLSIPSRGATDASIFHPYMLCVKAPSQLYTEASTNNFILMRLKGDKNVNHALDSRLEREQNWTRKSSTVVSANKIYLSNLDKGQYVIPGEDFTRTERDANIKNAKKATKITLKEETLKKWKEKVEKLVMQGDFIKLLEEEQEDVTWKSIANNIPKGVLSFALKASTNSLNSPDNLRRWGKIKLANCALCGNYCTLEHILNFCSVAKNQGRFTWGHNSVLNYLCLELKDKLPENLQMYSDLDQYSLNGGTIPPDILCTLQRPDLTLIDRSKKKITILELTCSFEQNINSANIRKLGKYQDLKKDIEKNGYSVTLLPFEIGSRGQVTKRNKTALENIFKIMQIKIKTGPVFKNMSKISLLGSFTVFQAQAQPTWQNPPYLSP